MHEQVSLHKHLMFYFLCYCDICIFKITAVVHYPKDFSAVQQILLHSLQYR